MRLLSTRPRNTTEVLSELVIEFKVDDEPKLVGPNNDLLYKPLSLTELETNPAKRMGARILKRAAYTPNRALKGLVKGSPHRLPDREVGQAALIGYEDDDDQRWAMKVAVPVKSELLQAQAEVVIVGYELPMTIADKIESEDNPAILKDQFLYTVPTAILNVINKTRAS